jgi:hypothetical protein
MTTKHDSFAYAAHTRSAKQLACLDLINEYTFLKEKGAPAVRLLVLRQTIEESLDDFATKCDHPRPKWIIPTLRAIALSSFGELRAAIEVETEAMKFAQDAVDRSKNLSNRGEYARQLAATLSEGPERNNLIASAVEDSLKALALSAGQNKGIALTASLAFAEAGMLEEADDLICRVSEDSDILNEQGDSLRTHLLNDLNFRKLRSILPTLERLYSIIERA